MGLRAMWRKAKMDKAWRDVKAELLEQVEHVIIHDANEDIYFNGHRYLHLDGKFWKDHKPSTIGEWLKLRDEIMSMGV